MSALFANTPLNKPIEPRERITMFLKLLYENTDTPNSYKEAHTLMFNLLAHVEEEAGAHNKAFCLIHEPVPMGIDSLGDFFFLAKHGGRVAYRRTTKQYLLISIDGAIQIHQFVEGQKIETYWQRYRDKSDDILILTRPDYLGNDVWRRPLPCAIEHFSTHKK